MSASTRYASLAELRQRLDLTGTETYSAAEDAVHGAVLDAVSQAIGAYCEDAFYLTDTGTVRYLTAEYPDILVVPSLVSIDSGGLVGDETNNGDSVHVPCWPTGRAHYWPLGLARRAAGGEGGVPARIAADATAATGAVGYRGVGGIGQIRGDAEHAPDKQADAVAVPAHVRACRGGTVRSGQDCHQDHARGGRGQGIRGADPKILRPAHDPGAFQGGSARASAG